MHYAIGYTPPPTERSRELHGVIVPRGVPPGILRDTIGAAPPTGDSLVAVSIPKGKALFAPNKRP